MKKYTFRVTINVTVETDLELENAIDEFQSETDYNLTSTDNVKVIHQQFTEIELS